MSRRRLHSSAGITLLEMMIVLAVLALLAGALTVGYRRLPQTALKREATRLAAMLRSAYDRATASGAHHRLVIDIAASTFFLERCEGRIQVRKSHDLNEEAERQRAEAEKESRLAGGQSAGDFLDAIVKDAGQKVGSTASCEPVQGPLGKKQTLGGMPRVSFARIHVAHLEQPATTGEVTLNFFPLGTAERSVIVLGVGEEGEDFFSIAIRPLSGRIEMTQGEWKDIDATMTEDAEGRDIK